MAVIRGGVSRSSMTSQDKGALTPGPEMRVACSACVWEYTRGELGDEGPL